MIHYRKRIGLEAEDFACSLLANKGYKIISRNYRNRFGEIDIIAIDNDSIVFVEVKFRSNFLFGLPEESIDRRKIQRIEKTGYFFWKARFPHIRKARIDVVALTRKRNLFLGKVIRSVGL